MSEGSREAAKGFAAGASDFALFAASREPVPFGTSSDLCVFASLWENIRGCFGLSPAGIATGVRSILLILLQPPCV